MEAMTGARKSSYSGKQGNCVEAGEVEDLVGIEDTKDRGAGRLVISRADFGGFLREVRDGQFDDLLL